MAFDKGFFGDAISSAGDSIGNFLDYAAGIGDSSEPANYSLPSIADVPMPDFSGIGSGLYDMGGGDPFSNVLGKAKMLLMNPSLRTAQPAQHSAQAAAAPASVGGGYAGAVPIDMSSQAAYKASLIANARAVAAKYDLPAEIMAAIPIQEAGWTGSELTRRANNLFSIKGEGPAGSEHFGSVWEVVNGQNVRVPASFRKYNNTAESFDDFAKLILENPRYSNAVNIWRQTHDPTAFIRAVGQAGYATDPTWADKVASIAQGMR